MKHLQVIDRKVRELNLNTDILPLETQAKDLTKKGYKYDIDFINYML